MSAARDDELAVAYLTAALTAPPATWRRVDPPAPTPAPEVTRFEWNELGMLHAPEAGRYVLFSDVEAALRNRKMLGWLLPIMDGPDDAAALRRTQALGAGIRLGLTGEHLVQFAMEGCPE